MPKQVLLPPCPRINGPLSAETLIRKPLFRGTELILTENTPAWHLTRYKLLKLAEHTLKFSRAETALTGQTAALAYVLPTFNQQMVIEICYLQVNKSGNSHVGTTSTNATTKVKRKQRNYPIEAIDEINGLRVLRWDYFIIELLSQTDVRTAMINANALIRKIFQVERETAATLKQKLPEIQQYLLNLCQQYAPKKYRKRIMRRLNWINPLCESILESLTFVALLQLNLEVISQASVKYGSTTYWLDFLWIDKRGRERYVGIECDGFEKQADSQYFFREDYRESAIKVQGIDLVRYNSKQIMDIRFVEVLASELSVPIRRSLKNM
ncbi:hypothetical protein HMPREF0044_1506 [Gleimia coleocanis DSM 15436]|uniref:DUF559 domain-containing protein n=1 Tax=Gleimia coleocanis DSM 15436 TaxID=525245 RepID=C0W253_9ACTO|nr:hypothetical protein [Gleimia coleocanis]EEH63267.1 hypothetical protein HMPREF0044_1506 [Gleimia coleocanis DSM 15436]